MNREILEPKLVELIAGLRHSQVVQAMRLLLDYIDARGSNSGIATPVAAAERDDSEILERALRVSEAYTKYGWCKETNDTIEHLAAALATPVAAAEPAPSSEPVAWWRHSYIDEWGNSDADVQIGANKPTAQVLADNGFPWQPLYGEPLATPVAAAEPEVENPYEESWRAIQSAVRAHFPQVKEPIGLWAVLDLLKTLAPPVAAAESVPSDPHGTGQDEMERRYRTKFSTEGGGKSMTLLAIDYESRFGARFGGADTLSITSQGLEAYVRDWRFKAHGAAVSVDWGPDEWITHKDLPAFLAQFDWPRTTCLSHNSQFDSLVTSHHYGHVAGAYLCTQQMARMLAMPGASLAKMALYFDLPPKGKDLHLSMGVADLPPHIEERIAAYSKHDNWLCREIFKRMRTMLPQAELATISNVVKMFVRPLMRINPEPLVARIAEIDIKHAGLMAEAGLARTQIMSNLQMAAFLRAEGIEWGDQSMAKTNPEFLELLEHPNDRIALAVAARLGIKGTMERSRCETFLRMGERGAACVYINAGGAGTTRFSGGDGTNYQNLKRGSPVRTCNEAPEGHELIISDSSQIEARILDGLAGQRDATERWRSGEDQYSILARKFYPDADTITKSLRNVGKVVMLASGYGMGAPTLQRQLSVGLMGNPPLHIDLATAEKWKNDYRTLKPMVVKLWHRADQWITAMAEGTDIDYMMLKIRAGRIELPNGLILRYPHLHQTPDGWTYKSQHGSYYKLWGGTLVQNVCEALARDVVIPQCNHVAKELPWVSSTHDEGVFVAPAERAEELTPWVEDCFRTVLPEWAKGWPINAEASHSPRYDK